MLLNKYKDSKHNNPESHLLKTESAENEQESVIQSTFVQIN